MRGYASSTHITHALLLSPYCMRWMCANWPNHKPSDRTKAVARQFVATHIRSALVSLPDAHLFEEASVVRLECQLLEHLRAAARFELRVGGCPKDVVPVQLVQAL